MSGKYIVVFKSTATQEDIDKYIDTVKSDGKLYSSGNIRDGLSSSGGQVGHKYDTVMKGFSATLSESAFNKLTSFQAQEDSVIDFIEPDGEVTTQ
ncbi:hypothetical protein B0H19DRAFT_1246631 [Mycena capillaripes]|nr:hypothetical protein B0H19DRAFT_1246631 [Mycena capillaripes]